MKPKYIPALILALGSLMVAASSAKQFNVLFIAIDDLRPEIGCYGNDEVKTPNMDRLAGKGVKFNRAYCQYPVCNPSRSSFLMGKRPDELGIVSNKISVRKKWPDLVSLPQLFRESGYYTAGLGKLYHVGLDDDQEQTLFRDDVSFDHQYKAHGNEPKIGRSGEGRKLGDGSIGWAQWLAAEGGDDAQKDGMLANEAVRVLEENHDKPFFLSVGFHKPHDPFFAPKDYFDLYPLDKVKLNNDPEDHSPRLEFSVPGSYDRFKSFNEQDCREFKRAYHACTTFVDAQVGKVFAAMDRLDLWDNTIVILLGDHGYHLGEHGWWNKVTVYELGANAPFMMWVPGARSMGNETDSVVEFLDIYPTLVDLCGLKARHKLSGKSLRPVLVNPSKPWKNAAYTQVTRGKTMGYSVVNDRWRFIQWGADGKGGYELYDQHKDTKNYYNLAENPEYKTVRKQMEKLLEKGYPNL